MLVWGLLGDLMLVGCASGVSILVAGGMVEGPATSSLLCDHAPSGVQCFVSPPSLCNNPPMRCCSPKVLHAGCAVLC